MQLSPAAEGDPSITSATIEGAIYQMLELVQHAESDSTANVSGEDRVNLTSNLNSLEYRGSIRFSASSMTDENGKFHLTSSDYISIPGWSSGDGSGTLKSSTWSGQLLELITAFANAQTNASRNPNLTQWVELDYDFLTKEIVFTIRSLPLERVKTDSGWAYTGVEVMQ
ncbi:hypothetical protein [Roseofilum casamattae]|uniref:Uncharacterized protein n=1 Tax=Roseofilum casamattae BLCC-M143 TaxID=3022442 RepID=A0ABT7C374_9CYAN|nr:hypothetical protein [Roseofilum casamattae]MDJ1185913.1 hypothetical protein [Roseofilum casamattae BLCC-M143]